MFGYIDSFTLLRIGLFSLGLVAGLFLPSSLTSIANIVPPRFLARGMAIHELAPNLGFVLAPLLADFLLNWLTWREVIQSLGIIMVLVSLVYFFNKTGYIGKGQRIDFKDARDLLLQPRFLLMVCLFSLAICSTLGIYAMLPLFLVTSHGMEASYANNLLAISRVSSVLMPLLGGWLGDRFGNKLVIISVLLAGGCLTILLGVTKGTLLVLVAILQPMAAVCFFPSGFAVLAGLSTTDKGGLAVSLCIPFAFLAGGGCMPTLIGVIGDHASFNLSFIVVGILMVAGGSFAMFSAFFKGSIISLID